MNYSELQKAQDKIEELAAEVPKYGFGFVQDAVALKGIAKNLVAIANTFDLDASWVAGQLKLLSQVHGWRCTADQTLMLEKFAELAMLFPGLL